MGVDVLGQIGKQCKAVVYFCIREIVWAKCQYLLAGILSEKVSDIIDDANSSTLVGEEIKSAVSQEFVPLVELNRGRLRFDRRVAFAVCSQNLVGPAIGGCYHGHLLGLGMMRSYRTQWYISP